MSFPIPNLSLASPEIFLLSMACFTLVVDAFISKRFQAITYYLVQLTLIGAFSLGFAQFLHHKSQAISFSGHYVLDDLALTSKLFIYFFCFFAFSYARGYVEARKIQRSEYYLLSLFAVLGMSVMVSAYTLLTIYLGLELLSLCLYALVAMDQSAEKSSEAAMKYFVLGSLASGMLLYGISLFYGLTGSIQLNQIAVAITVHHDVVAMIALVFVLSGLIFKLGAVPFHMWIPDVYQGAPAPVTLFIASAPKIAAFAILTRVLVQGMPSLSVNWIQLLIVMSILSMFFGNLLAIAQTNFKRMLAYSSIAHVGYTLLGILAGPASPQGYSAAMFYISTYVLVAAGAFAIITLMSQQGVELENLTDYRGLNARHPWLAFMMLLLLFSMAGVPPTVGFFAKFGLLQALVQAQYVWLAALALLFALIGAYYYLRMVKLMYFDEPTAEMSREPIVISPYMLTLLTFNGLAALVLGLVPSYLIDLCRISI